MELDFKSIKALSSPTRIEILNQVIDRESTPTKISDEIGKTKSTVSSHLKKLESAGLVERTSEDERRRVTYSPTRKAEDIVKGKERNVKFSLTASALTAISAITLGGFGLLERSSRQFQSQDSADDLEVYMDGPEAAEPASETATATPELVSFSPEIFLYLAMFFIGLSVVSAFYGVMMNKLNGWN